MSESASVKGALGVLNAALPIVVEGLATVGVEVALSGGWNGTLIFEGAMSRGGVLSWFPLTMEDVVLFTTGTTTAVAGNFRGDVSAFSEMRVRVSVYVAGTATVVIQASEAVSSTGGSTTIANVYGLYTLAQQAAFAATMAWWLDPTAPATNTGTSVGSPIPPSEYTKRTTGLTISGAGLCTVTITNPSPTEVLHFPIGIPRGVELLLIGAGLVALHAGTVTTWRAQVPAVGTGTPCGVTDAALPAANSWTTYLNKRGRITAGPRAGICFWVEKDEGARTARVQQTYSIPVAYPFDDVPTLTDLVNTDPYVIETLPTIGGLDFSGWLDTDGFDDAEGDFAHRILIQDLRLAEPIADGATPSGVTRWKGGAGIVFINCSTGFVAPDGNLMWMLGSRSNTCQIETSGSLFVTGSAFDGEIALDQEGAFAQFDNCLLQGLHAFHVKAGSNVFIVGDTGAFDSANGGCDVKDSGSVLTCQAHFYGSGNAGQGVSATTGAQVVTTVLPNITGAGGNCNVDNVISTWANTPYRNMQTGSAVYATGLAGGTEFLPNKPGAAPTPVGGGNITEVAGALVHTGTAGTITTIAPA